MTKVPQATNEKVVDCHGTDGPPGPSAAKYVALGSHPGPSVVP